MKERITLLMAGLILAGTAMAFPNTDFPSWDNTSPTKVDYTTWHLAAIEAALAEVPAFGSSWANATGLAKSQTSDKLFSVSYAETAVPTCKNERIDPIVCTRSMTISGAGIGLHEEGDEAVKMQQFDIDGFSINSTYETISAAMTSGEANAQGVWTAWAIAPSSSAAYADDNIALSEGWSMSIASADMFANIKI